MADLILEFGCSPCYLQDLNCGADCIFELRIDLNQLFFSAPYAFDLGIDLNPLSPSTLSQPYFHQCVDRTFIVKEKFFRARIPDVYRYDLRYCNTKNEWVLCLPNSTGINNASKWQPKKLSDYKQNHYTHENPIENNESAKNILIILESPHDEEYHYPDALYQDFTALQPANGKTGENFFEYFTKDTNANGKTSSGGILNYSEPNLMPSTLKDFLNEDEVYRICFVNPVPFQTSLHFFHGKPLNKEITKDLRDIVWKKLFIHCQSDFIRRVQLYKPFAILNACTGDIKKPDSLKSRVKTALGNSHALYQFNTPHPSSWWSTNNRKCKKW